MNNNDMYPDYLMNDMSYIHEQARAYRAQFPEIYYRLQPYIMMACDEMEDYSPGMPTQEMLDEMTDSIYEEMMRMYPDMTDYMADSYESSSVVAQFDRGGPFDFRRRFRRRGLPRDLITILLLQELFRRRRRFRPY